MKSKTILRFASYGWLLAILFASAVLNTGCKRAEGIVGPEFVAAPEGFTVVGNSFTASKAAVAFGSSDSISFHAEFSSKVSWKITLTGQSSGAEMVIEGLGSEIDETSAVWENGGHTGVYFFETGETVTATLSFLGSSIALTDNFVLTSTRNWGSKANLYLPNNNGFETGNFSGWFEYNPPLNEIVTTPAAVEGLNCVYLFGNGAPDFVTGIGSPPGTHPGIPADPDSVYVNLYVYGSNNPNAFVSFQFKEADKDEANNDYADTDDDAWEGRISLNFTGWKLFSFKYSQLTASEAAAFGGSGNKVHEPDRIRVIQVGLQTSSSQYAEVWIDYPTITINGPFVPSI